MLGVVLAGLQHGLLPVLLPVDGGKLLPWLGEPVRPPVELRYALFTLRGDTLSALSRLMG